MNITITTIIEATTTMTIINNDFENQRDGMLQATFTVRCRSIVVIVIVGIVIVAFMLFAIVLFVVPC